MVASFAGFAKLKHCYFVLLTLSSFINCPFIQVLPVSSEWAEPWLIEELQGMAYQNGL